METNKELKTLNWSNDLENLKHIEEIDKIKTKVLKYIMYKKRTEKEVEQKFSSSVDADVLMEIIENLKELGYIDDAVYVERAVNEFMAINTLSIKEIKYKLYAKGICNDILEQYIDSNIELLQEYELESAKRIYNKKQNTMELDNIILFLKKKGYTSETIKKIKVLSSNK